jgi:hypothetical protein
VVMNRVATIGTGILLAGLTAASPAAAATAPAAGSWGRAFGVPGLRALGGDAEVSLVSCPAAGSCTVAGSYQDGRKAQGFVASERHGRWGQAIAIPGLRRLNAGGNAEIGSLSCVSPGNCAVGGAYQDASHFTQGFVASERRGVWGKAIGVPGLESFNAGGLALVLSVSCAAPGDCVATGFYADGSDGGGLSLGSQGFVASERDGRWGRAIPIPGLRALSHGDDNDGLSVSCSSPGNCTVGGEYGGGDDSLNGFLAIERGGSWAKATAVPGLDQLDTGQGDASIVSVSCVSTGYCAAAGFYTTRADAQLGFVIDRQHGRWGEAIASPGLAALNKGGDAELNSVSCVTAGNCVIGGDWLHDGAAQGFVVSQRQGTWGKAIEVPGLAALNKGRSAQVKSVSCASPGNCAAVGEYFDRSRREQAFVASQRHGAWGKAIEVPGLAVLEQGGNADALSVSCAPHGLCTAGGGTFGNHSARAEAFIVSQRSNP